MLIERWGEVVKEWTLWKEPPRPNTTRPDDVWFSPNGEVAATLESDRSNLSKVKQTVRLRNAATGAELRRWTLAGPP